MFVKGTSEVVEVVHMVEQKSQRGWQLMVGKEVKSEGIGEVGEVEGREAGG